MSRATGHSATAIRKQPSPLRPIASRSISAIRATPARRWRPTASSPTTIRMKTLRRPGQLPGAVQHSRRDGAGAEGAGQPAAAAHAAGLGWQLRRQAGRFSIYRFDRRGRARRGPSGEVDRGPARTSDGVGLGDQSRDHARAAPSMADGRVTRSTGTRSRIAAPICARRSRRRSIGCTAI